MPNKIAPARIDGIIAREANVAMVFRRGPREWSRGYLWNLDTDEVTPGDWVQAKVFTERCDLSPDGGHLVGGFYSYGSLAHLLAGTPQEGEVWQGGWTSISRVPSYAPLAMWVTPGAYGGGGSWRTADRIELNRATVDGWTLVEGSRWSFELNWSRLTLGFRSPFEQRLAASGWRVTQPMRAEIANVHDEEHQRRMAAMGSPVFDGTSESMRTLQEWYFERMAEHRPLRIDLQPEETARTFEGGQLARIKTSESVRWEARDAEGRVVLDFRPKPFQPQWLDLDHRGRVVYGDRGALWAWEGFPRGRPRLVADLNDDRPDEIGTLGWAR